MSKTIKKYYILLAIIGICLSIISLNLIFRLMSSDKSLDMTDSAHYSLSEYSINQAQELNSPLYITIYYSTAIQSENPQYGRYASFVMRFIQQYQRQNPNNIFVIVKNPEPYSPIEQEAQSKKITAHLSSTGQSNLYFGVTFSDGDNQEYTIPSFSQDRSFWLEKDITNMIAKFNNPERPIVGLISPIHKMIDREYGKGVHSTAFIQELSTRYDIQELASNVAEIPHNINTLLLVTPRQMSQSLIYALDQYVMRGGKVIMLLDNFIEEPHYKTTQDTLNDINQLLNHWGVNLSDKIIGSKTHGQKIFITSDDATQLKTYPLWLELKQDAINQNTNFSSNIRDIHLRSATALKRTQLERNAEYIPILEISEGYEYPSSEYFADKNHIINSYQGENNKHILAYLISGKFPSFFNEVPARLNNFISLPYLYYSAKPSQIFIIGDSDFIRDDVWENDKILNDNGQFLLRIIESFNDNSDIGLLQKSQILHTQDTLGKRIYDTIFNRHSIKLNSLQAELQNLQSQQSELYQGIKNNLIALDANNSRILSDLQNKIDDIQNQLRYYDFQLKQSFSSKTQSIIFVNLIVFPLVLVIIMIVVYNIYARRYQQKIREKYNAHK